LAAFLEHHFVLIKAPSRDQQKGDGGNLPLCLLFPERSRLVLIYGSPSWPSMILAT
jgi:hypothetical protein